MKLSEQIRQKPETANKVIPAFQRKLWADEVAQLEAESAALKRDARDLHEWLSVEFPRAFEALQAKVLNPDALLTAEEEHEASQ